MNTSRRLALVAVAILPGTSIAGDLLDYPGPGYRMQPEQVLLHEEKTTTPGRNILFQLLPNDQRRIDVLQPGKVSLSLDPNAPAAPTLSPQKMAE